MRAARILVLGIALAAGGAAAFLMGSDGGNKPEAPPTPVVQQFPTVDVLIAKGDIGMGVAVSADNFTWQAWPEATTGDSYVTPARARSATWANDPNSTPDPST